MTSPSDHWNEWVTKSRVLLSGYIKEQASGLTSRKFVVDAEEADCRVALAAILSTGSPPKEICELLAALIAPDWSVVAAERKINFAFRRKGRVRDRIRDTQIADRVYRLIKSGISVETAIGAVAVEIHMSEDTVSGIWKRYKAHRDAGLWPV